MVFKLPKGKKTFKIVVTKNGIADRFPVVVAKNRKAAEQQVRIKLERGEAIARPLRRRKK